MVAVAIVCASIIVEGVVTYITAFYKNGKIQWQVLLSIALGVLVTIAYRLDIFSMLPMESTIPFLGYILTGILVSRGSNYVFDLIKTLTQLASKLTL